MLIYQQVSICPSQLLVLTSLVSLSSPILKSKTKNNTKIPVDHYSGVQWNHIRKWKRKVSKALLWLPRWAEGRQNKRVGELPDIYFGWISSGAVAKRRNVWSVWRLLEAQGVCGKTQRDWTWKSVPIYDCLIGIIGNLKGYHTVSPPNSVKFLLSAEIFCGIADQIFLILPEYHRDCIRNFLPVKFPQ